MEANVEAGGGSPVEPPHTRAELINRAKVSKPVGIRARSGSARKAQAQPPTGSEPSVEEIARLAYSYWEARGYQGGSPEEDWYRAVEELRKRRAPRA